MKKFMAVCGSGLGTSFMVEMNIKSVLAKLGIDDIEVSHTDLGSATVGMADVFFLAKDIAEGGSHLGQVVVLDSIIDMNELEEKVKEGLKLIGR